MVVTTLGVWGCGEISTLLRGIFVVFDLFFHSPKPSVSRIYRFTLYLGLNFTLLDSLLFACVLWSNSLYSRDLFMHTCALLLHVILLVTVHDLCHSPSPIMVLSSLLACALVLFVRLKGHALDLCRLRLRDIQEESVAIKAEIISIKGKFYSDRNEAIKLTRARSSGAKDQVIAKLQRLNPTTKRFNRTLTQTGERYAAEPALFERSSKRKYTLEEDSLGMSSNEASLNWMPDMQASLGSSSNSKENELSAEDLEGLMTDIMSKEYVLWHYRKRPSLRSGEELGLLQQLQQFTSSLPAVPSTVFTLAPLRVLIEENEELAEVLNHVGEWDFNAFDLKKFTSHPLKEVSNYLFSTHSLPEKFLISRESLSKFLSEVEDSYSRENYYHTSLHAADVLNSVVFLLTSGLHRCGHILDLEVFGLMVAAIGHDISHPGVNNAYLVSNCDLLALRYNDKSVLEMMHAAKVFNIIRKQDCNIAIGLCIADFQRFRKIVIDTILATDLQRHFSIQADYRVELEEACKSLEDEQFRLKTLEICIKCADLGHAAKETSLHIHWTHLISLEFFVQGEKEEALGLPISPLCDRRNVVIPRSQIGFLTVMVKPLFDLWAELVRTYGEWEDTLDLPFEVLDRRIAENIHFWQTEMELVERGSEYKIPDIKPSMRD